MSFNFNATFSRSSIIIILLTTAYDHWPPIHDSTAFGFASCMPTTVKFTRNLKRKKIMADIDQDFEHKHQKGKTLYDMTLILYHRYHRTQKECKENEHYTHKGNNFVWKVRGSNSITYKAPPFPCQEREETILQGQAQLETSPNCDNIFIFDAIES